MESEGLFISVNTLMGVCHAILLDCGRVWVTDTREGQILHTEGLCHKVNTSVSTLNYDAFCLFVFCLFGRF